MATSDCGVLPMPDRRGASMLPHMQKHLRQVVHFFALLAGAAVVVTAMIESGVGHTLAILGGWIIFVAIGLVLARATSRRQHRQS